MKKIKADKNTQSICNTLNYNSQEVMQKNAIAAEKKVNIKNKTIIFEFQKENMMVTIPTYYVPKRNSNLGKIFAYILSEIPFDINGSPIETKIKIPIKNFSKDGLYTRTNTAARGLITASKVLRHIEIEITKRNPYNKAVMEGLSYRCDALFNGFSISDDEKTLTISVNKDAPWKLFKNQYINVPDEWFALSSRSFDLVQNSAIVARRAATTIVKQGYIDIDLREVAFWLALPSDEDTRNSGKLIKKPIINSIDEANSIHSDFIFEPHFDETKSVSDFLDRGFVRVFVDGKTKADLEIIARRRTVYTQ